MIRGPLILTWPCSFRSILLQRESITFSDKCAGLHGARHVREWFEETLRSRDGSLSSTENTPCSERISYYRSDCQQLREASFQNLSPRASDACNLSQKPQTLSTNFHCFTTFDPHRGPVDLCHKTQRNHRRFSGWFSLSEPSSHNRQRYRPSFVQSRAAHVAAPRGADAWRDCLTLENENRCRRSLKPNLRLYDTDTRQKGDGQGRATNPGKCASVLVSLCCVAGEPAVLFTLRSSTLKGRHKGDVSFAGGKSDPSDKDVVATALREAREELGVTVATEKVWGVLKPLRDMSGMMIAPVVANVGPFEELSLKPNPGEVEEVFTLSLSHLCNPHNRGYTHFRTGDKYAYTVPVFRNGKHRVWGLTAIVLDQTLKLIVPS